MLLYNDDLYVLGGRKNANNRIKFADSLYKFNTKIQEWSKLQPTTVPSFETIRDSHSAFIHNGFMYSYGGCVQDSLDNDNHKLFNDIHRLDLKYLNWTQVQTKGPLPALREGQNLVLLPKHNLCLLFGGWDSNTNEFFQEIFSFDLINHEWKLFPANCITGVPCSPIESQTSCLYEDNILLNFGGQGLNETYTNTLTKIEVKFNKNIELEVSTLTPKGESPSPRSSHNSLIYKNYFFIIAGEFENQQNLNDVWAYDIFLNQWFEIIPNNPTDATLRQRIAHASCLVNEDIYIFGGYSSGEIFGDLVVLSLNNRGVKLEAETNESYQYYSLTKNSTSFHQIENDSVQQKNADSQREIMIQEQPESSEHLAQCSFHTLQPQQ